MQIFNIVEELEKERKKNKELEEENKKLSNVIYKDYVVKDLENKIYWLKNDNVVYEYRINKAIEYIEKNNYTYAGLEEPETEKLLNILKGDNK